MYSKLYTIIRNKGWKLFSCCFLVLFLGNTNSNAQSYCANELVYWYENFGTGTTATSHPDVLNLIYQSSGEMEDEGIYRVINNTQQKPEWHFSPDHTPNDIDGKMLVINGLAETFFSHVVNRPAGFAAGNYAASLFLMNVNTPGTCAPNPLLPSITFFVEYQDANNNWMALANSPVISGSIPQSVNPTWVQIGGVFLLPTTGNFQVKNIRITLSDGTVGGCGNDFAIDDIKFASCPAGGPVPVKFLDIRASQKGMGALIEWSTASELNNKYFDVEKSTDGGLNWEAIESVMSNGNSSSIRNYSAYDPKPISGTNLYRIRQIDLDGNSRLSNTASYNLKIVKTDIFNVQNPFSNIIKLDFRSADNQIVVVRILDMAGRQMYVQQSAISKGNSTKSIAGLERMNSGLYILQITGEQGAVLYNGKLIKQ